MFSECLVNGFLLPYKWNASKLHLILLRLQYIVSQFQENRMYYEIETVVYMLHRFSAYIVFVDQK